MYANGRELVAEYRNELAQRGRGCGNNVVELRLVGDDVGERVHWENGRGGEIRTHDFLLPKQAR